MMIPYIKKYSSDRTPWEVYQAVDAQHQTAFFLDTPARENAQKEKGRNGKSFSYIGWSPFATARLQNGFLEVRENQRCRKYPAAQLWTVLRAFFKKHQVSGKKEVPFFSGGAVGYWGYELVSTFEKIKFRRKKKWGGLPDLFLGFYRNLIVYDHQAKCYWLVTHSSKRVFGNRRFTGEPRAFKEMETFFTEKITAPAAFDFSGFHANTGKKKFESMVGLAQNYIADGDIYQANLSQRFHFDFRGNPCTLYDTLRKLNPSPFASFLKMGPLRIVSSSPERLVRKQGDQCETKPIAGTRPRAAGQDSLLSKELFHNEKERAEHLMLVDLERNDLGRVCRWSSVRVEELMAIEKYSHVIHLVSEITGRLRKDRDVFDLIQAMFPGGTITGCPKIRCMEIIDELEPAHRGIYTGSIGYVDFRGNADLNIVIRTLVLKCGAAKKNKNRASLCSGRGFYQTGAGIVHDSIPRKEYEETIHKGMALREALKKASKTKKRTKL